MQCGSAGGSVIEARRRRRSFGDELIAEEIEDLQENWMRQVDVVLQELPVLGRGVRANLVFTRVGAGPVVIKEIHDRVVQIAPARKVVQRRKMRVDTTVVSWETEHSERSRKVRLQSAPIIREARSTWTERQ
jgi:hypothetical protein